MIVLLALGVVGESLPPRTYETLSKEPASGGLFRAPDDPSQGFPLML